MAKGKSKKAKAQEVEQEQKPLTIIEAKLRDGYCDYRILILEGPQTGDKGKFTGAGKVTDDMYNAFKVFNRHFACMDDVFEHSGIDIENIDDFENHELTSLYVVDGFKISGPAESESIELIGSKSLSAGGRSSHTTPKYPLDQLSGYKWYNELKTAADHARMEVELYREGKKLIEDEDDKPNPKQLNAFVNQDADENDGFGDAKL